MRIYADHAATTPVRDEVLQAMLPFFTSVYGNPSSLHTEGQEARIAVENARRKLAKAVGAGKEEMIFTSGGTESNHLAIHSALSTKKGNHLIISSVEHASVLKAARSLEKAGYHISYLPVNRFGVADPDQLKDLITEETVLVSCQMVNNEIGSRMPVEKMGMICQSCGIVFHVDAVQALGKIRIDLSDFPVDLMSFSAHKIGGPKGIGALYCRDKKMMRPFFPGGEQERGARPGTEYVPGIVGFGEAATIAAQETVLSSQKVRSLQDQLVSGLIREIPNIHFNGPLYGAENRNEIPPTEIPGYINVRFEGIEGETLVQFADMEGLAISSGSACQEGTDQPSHVLTALGLSLKEARESVRITIGAEQSLSQIDEMIRIFRSIVPRLRDLRRI